MSLAALFAQLGTTGTQVAARADVPVELLERVDQGRQPLQRGLARRIASILGAEYGTVIGAAGLWVDSDDPRYLVPIPPDPSTFGDPLRPTPLRLTGPTPPVGEASATGVWVASSDGSGDPGTGTLLHVDRNTGSLLATVAFAKIARPGEVAVDGNGKLWTADTLSVDGGFYFARVHPRLAAIELEAHAGLTSAPEHLVAEPATGTIWASSGDGLVQIDTATGAGFLVASLDGDYLPAHAVAVAGLLYVVATSSGMSNGRLIEVDPMTGAQTRISSGTAFGANANGVAYDAGTDSFFVTDTTGGPNQFWRVPRSSFAASAFVVTGLDPSLQGATEAAAGGGKLLFVDSTMVSSVQVAAFYVVDPVTGAVLGQWNDVESSGVGRNAIFDGAWFWVSDDNLVQKLVPSDARPLLPFSSHLDVPCRGLASL